MGLVNTVVPLEELEQVGGVNEVDAVLSLLRCLFVRVGGNHCTAVSCRCKNNSVRVRRTRVVLRYRTLTRIFGTLASEGHGRCTLDRRL